MAAPPQGLMQQFGVLASSGVTVAVAATVNGDVGSCPTPSITGAGLSTVPPFTVHPAADAIVCSAQADATTASNNLAGQIGGATTLLAQLGGTTVNPGVYNFTSTADIAAGPGPLSILTLSGSGSYVFIVGSTVTANIGSSVVLTNGADACQVFWQVGSSATLSGADFPGTVISQASVTLNNGANLIGRAVALNGAVTLSGPSNAVGGCSTLIAAGVPALPHGMVLALMVILAGTGAYLLGRR